MSDWSARDLFFYTERPSAALRLAQVIGLTSTAFLCGRQFGASFSTTPALLLAPAPLLVRQWKSTYDTEAGLSRALVLAGTPLLGLLSYREIFGTSRQILYATAATLLATTIPYTFAIMMPLNKKLFEKHEALANASLTDAAAEVGAAEEETVHQLVDQWATANLGRTAITALSAIFATWAAVDKTEVVGAALGFATGADRIG